MFSTTHGFDMQIGMQIPLIHRGACAVFSLVVIVTTFGPHHKLLVGGVNVFILLLIFVLTKSIARAVRRTPALILPPAQPRRHRYAAPGPAGRAFIIDFACPLWSNRALQSSCRPAISFERSGSR